MNELFFPLFLKYDFKRKMELQEHKWESLRKFKFSQSEYLFS